MLAICVPLFLTGKPVASTHSLSSKQAVLCIENAMHCLSRLNKTHGNVTASWTTTRARIARAHRTNEQHCVQYRNCTHRFSSGTQGVANRVSHMCAAKRATLETQMRNIINWNRIEIKYCREYCRIEEKFTKVSRLIFYLMTGSPCLWCCSLIIILIIIQYTVCPSLKYISKVYTVQVLMPSFRTVSGDCM